MRKRKSSPLIAEGIWDRGTIKKRVFGGIESALSFDNLPEEISKSRITYLKFLIVLAFAAFGLRLFQLSIIEGEKNKSLSENNRIRLIKEESPRGKIFDRKGKLLAYSKVAYFLTDEGLSKEINLEQKEELENENLAGEDFSGPLGKIQKEIKRVYPFLDLAAHPVGYTSLVLEEDLKKNPSLSTKDFVGRLGVEESYDEVLRGIAGRKIVEVDAKGKVISVLEQQEGKPGQDIYLSLDIDIQKKACESLARQIDKSEVMAGALVASNPKNGEILALCSIPSFDPEDIGKFVAREDKPLFNRAIAGTYTPGSVFKINTSLAALESGKITKDTEIEDTGQFELGGLRFVNWYFLSYGGKDGIVKIDRALARSNDIFFYKIGEQTGVEAIRTMAQKLGLGQKTGIDLPGEEVGLVGDALWKKANYSSDWYLGDTMHMAIGQGFVVTTPVQVNKMTNFVANGGKLVRPHLVVKVSSLPGDIKVDDQTPVSLPLSQDNLQIVRGGMRQACEKGGTAWPFFDASYKVGCKTGTAEKSLGNPHAWFTAFAPYDDPQISVTLIIEDGGEGSSVAAPVAKEVMDFLFKTKEIK